MTPCTFENVCGRSDTRAGNTCGPYGDSLESFGPSQLSVTRIPFSANPPELRTFPVDVAATARYQQTVSVSGATLPRYCCYSQCTPSRVASPPPLQSKPGMRVETTCVPAPAGTSAGVSGAPHPDNPDCPATHQQHPYTHGTNAQCCYGHLAPIPPPEPERRPYRGRAARVDGVPRVAAVHSGATWASDVGDLGPIGADDRARLRDAWIKAGQMEHASIAAFSALSLRLLALGAPAELVARTHAAALDEVRHAQLAFSLASAYAGHAVQPATFSDAGRLAIAGTLVELAVETFVDGCVNEAAAALEAAIAAEQAEDATIAAALRQIADDETRHAELAWAIVAWCVRVDPSVATRLEAALATMAVDETVTAAVDEDVGLGRHGVLSRAAAAEARSDTLHGVVEPCLAALLRDARYGSRVTAGDTVPELV